MSKDLGKLWTYELHLRYFEVTKNSVLILSMTDLDVTLQIVIQSSCCTAQLLPTPASMLKVAIKIPHIPYQLKFSGVVALYQLYDILLRFDGGIGIGTCTT